MYKPDNDMKITQAVPITLTSSLTFGAKKSFVSGVGTHTVSFSLKENNCQYITYTNIIIPHNNVSPTTVNIKNAQGTIVATQNYSNAAYYTFTFSAPSAGNYTIEFTTKTNYACRIEVDDVKISYDSVRVDTVCNSGGKARYRFAFGGHEKDNEVHGEGNWYTFGDYGYDPRIVQRPRTDPDSKTSPSWSPYRVFFDNPIRFADANGNFEIDEATAAAYPKLDAYLKNIAKVYANKPEAFKNAFKQYGQLSDAQVDKMLQYKRVNNGTPVTPNQETPRIAVTDVGDNFGTTPVRIGLDANQNNVNKISTKGTILLSKGFVEQFEKQENAFEKDGIDNIERKATNLLLEVTIFHEGTHYGDAMEGKPDISQYKVIKDDKGTSKVSTTVEGGEEFEKKAYGKVIDRESAKQVVNENEKNNK